MSNLLDVKQVAALFDVSTRWVQRLVDEHDMPRAERGQYDAVTVVRWYIRFLKKEATESDTHQRTRLQRANADLRELDLAKRRGELVEVETIKNAVTDLILASKARLLSIPTKMAASLARTSKPANIKKNWKRRYFALLRT
jgi:phage terminase Nu1 subunit (DNA packaging protein)